jgi:predicted permease
MTLVLTSVGLGVLLARLGAMPAHTPQVLNAWVLRVALPAVVLRLIPSMTFDASLAAPALAPWAVFVGAAMVMTALGRALRWSRALTGALILTAGLGNTSFAGLPLIEAVLGPEALAPALVADQLGSFLVLSTGGLWVAALASGDALSPRAVADRILRFPPFHALIAALALRALGGVPAWAEPTLQVLGATLTPVALFSVGHQLSWRAITHHPAWWLTGLTWKLLLAPAMVAAVVGAGSLHAQVAVLQAAMAPMVTGGILAQERGLEPDLAATMVGVGLFASLLTVPLWGWLLAG